ncbi:carboxypeptidase-like regulatory domain-containing protein [Segetibacter sp. 3557_3]|uniref:DUF5686 and carboxypeptidase regulatory-like domain-containing protein n=1 Tax=Segetibacter sp. 3557_3 TaxID=2547429 RepID=UPI0010584C46|nr:DUF5686 and carboxypeptidase regulatory-like domain-containing protein [Segetibacter sp. 3557_3]TDH28601.1 carboxypeptidase-like regulatory domain-containing protein [Segetibacter sp. 3557_3]
MPKTLLIILLIGITASVQSQTYKLTGKVTNAAREPVAFVSVQVKEWQSGTVTREDGTYSLSLEEGKYDIVYSILGYKSQLITIVVNRNYVQNIILEEDLQQLTGVAVKTKYKDPAVAVITNVIRHKDSLQKAVGSWSCNIYIKAVQQDSVPRTPKSKNKTDTLSKGNADVAGMAMTEILLRLDYASEHKIKEERLGVKRSGSSQDLFYLSATEGFFNFYNNLVTVPGLSTAKFVSPVSYSGLLAYRYKTINITQRGNYKVYTISIRPRLMSNATVEGEVTISDSNYTIEHTRIRFPRFHLPQYDFFEVEQWYSAQQNFSLLTKQVFTYNSKSARNKLSGVTTVTYGEYELNKTFPPHYFGLEVSATTEDAYKRDSTFWDTARVEPLTDKELKLIRYRDSIYRVTHSRQYLDSIDRLTNKFTWKKALLTGQTLYNRELERTWQLPPLPGLFQPFQFGGARINPGVYYAKTYKSKKNLSLAADLSYGIRNHDLNGSVRINRMYNPFNRGFYGISVRRDFEFIFQGDAWINMLKRSNLYLNNALGLYHGVEIKNGLFLYTDLEVALRRSLQDYKTGNTVDSLFGSALPDNNPISFESYNAVYGKIRLEYTPRQRYIREPREKIILGSAWPTFYTTWRKGISGVFGSQVNFDFWDVGMRQEINFGLLGILRYNLTSGTFLNRRDLRTIDYQWQRRGDPILFANPDGAFQALDSTFPVFKRFYQGHVVHEFNGYFINKIPLLKKLQLREVAGAGFLSVPERNLRYAETFAGVERVFKWPFNVGSKFKLGVYVVGSVANRFTNPLTFKIGVTSWDKRRNKWF